jgi:hypothetical protein
MVSFLGWNGMERFSQVPALPDREAARWPLPANLAFLRIPHFLTVKQLDGHFRHIWPF